MKKYLFLFLLLCVGSAFYFIFPIKSTSQYAKLKNGQFIIENSLFYPLAVNFMSSFQTDGFSLWVNSYKGYNPDSKYFYQSKDSSLMQLKADMAEIKEMGFNTVRIVGIGEPWFDEKNNTISIPAGMKNGNDTTFVLHNDSLFDFYLNSLDELFEIVEKSGLKVIFLIKNIPHSNSSDYLLKKFCQKFNDTECILAIDIFNEPLYFDKPEKEKSEIYEITKHWRKIIKMYAPNHLVTIGLEGIREVFRWDPNILDVDFISYHPYEYEPEQVRNEIYWYGKYTEIPWIIGETAIPADNDSIPYEEQLLFARKTLKQVANCGGQGYSWWQYKDVDWQYFHADYMGLINRNGWMKNKQYNFPIYGKKKPIVSEFVNYQYVPNPDSCLCLDNYYNYSESDVFRITGSITDSSGSPLEGAVILAWNENWSHSYHSITKKDGSFELLGSYPFYHWMASATKYTMIRGELKPDTAKIFADSKLPTINLGAIPIKKLPFLE